MGEPRADGHGLLFRVYLRQLGRRLVFASFHLPGPPLLMTRDPAKGARYRSQAMFLVVSILPFGATVVKLGFWHVSNGQLRRVQRVSLLFTCRFYRLKILFAVVLRLSLGLTNFIPPSESIPVSKCLLIIRLSLFLLL